VAIIIISGQDKDFIAQANIYPRGALLAAHPLQRVADGLHFDKVVLYTRSNARIVLAWIEAHPSKQATTLLLTR